MMIRILRSTVVVVDGSARLADPGDLVSVTANQAASLVAMGKAVTVDAPAGPVAAEAAGIETPEAAQGPIETTRRKPKRSNKS